MRNFSYHLLPFRLGKRQTSPSMYRIFYQLAENTIKINKSNAGHLNQTDCFFKRRVTDVATRQIRRSCNTAERVKMHSGAKSKLVWILISCITRNRSFYGLFRYQIFAIYTRKYGIVSNPSRYSLNDGIMTATNKR